MADTVLGEMPEATCSDCGTKGCVYRHWGPLVPRGKVGQFCIECWRKRVDHYNRHGSALPMETKDDESKATPAEA